MAAGVVPQSSWSLKPAAPASRTSFKPPGSEVAFPRKAEVHRKAIGRLQHHFDLGRRRRASRRAGAWAGLVVAAVHGRRVQRQSHLHIAAVQMNGCDVDASLLKSFLASDRFRSNPNGHARRRAGHGIRAGLAIPYIVALETDVGLDYSLDGVHNQVHW